MIAWLLAAELLSAADPPPLTPLAKIVALCTDQVRARAPEGAFDAYVDPAGDVQYFGTKAELFQFEKCLAMRGIGPRLDEAPAPKALQKGDEPYRAR